MTNPLKIIKHGIVDENPVFVQAIAMCPLLAVTTNAIDGVGMGLATTAVLCGSNMAISLIRRFIPDKVRIPAYIVVIATFTTIIEMLLKAYLPDLYRALGIFISLIVVNCIIYARAEVFAAKNGPFKSFLDGIGMGLGFTVALAILGIIRELLGDGAFFGMEFVPEAVPRTILMILPPGAFLVLGGLMALYAFYRTKRMMKKTAAVTESKTEGGAES
jgi:electron transport complex protein RnfE